jgi:hypothetical protein
VVVTPGAGVVRIPVLIRPLGCRIAAESLRGRVRIVPAGGGRRTTVDCASTLDGNIEIVITISVAIAIDPFI